MEKYPDFKPLKYEKLRWKTITDEEVFNIDDKMNEIPEDKRNLFIVDDDFYDKNIVNRWTGQWLAGNDTWVLCFTNRIPYDQYYRPGLIARSAHVLSDVYRDKGDQNIKFGLIDTYN